MDFHTEGNRVNITDDYMFGYVMRQKGICKKMIQCLLPELKIVDVKFKNEDDSVFQDKQIRSNTAYGIFDVALIYIQVLNRYGYFYTNLN